MSPKTTSRGLGLALLVLLTTCTNPFYPVGPNDQVSANPIPGNPEPPTPYITMTTMTTTTTIVGLALAGSGEAVIDWGNGTSVLTVTLNATPQNSYRGGLLPISNTIRVDGEAITHLGCPNNNLTSLDVSHNPALYRLFCNGNNITSLILSDNGSLEWLQCDDNSLTSLDLSNNLALTFLNCVNNNLDAAALNALFGTLPLRQPADNARIVCGGNPGYDGDLANGEIDPTGIAIAEAKNWQVSL